MTDSATDWMIDAFCAGGPRARPVPISVEEMQDICDIAAARLNAGRNRPGEVGSDYRRMEIIGVMGEWAVAKYFDAWPDRWVFPGRYGPSHDLLVEGYLCGIKATDHFPAPNLIVREWDRSNDIYFLVSCLPEGPVAWIRGYATKAMVQRARTYAFRDGARPSRNIPYTELIEISVEERRDYA